MATKSGFWEMKVARKVVDDGEDDDETTESTKNISTAKPKVKEEDLVDALIDPEPTGATELHDKRKHLGLSMQDWVKSIPVVIPTSGTL